MTKHLSVTLLAACLPLVAAQVAGAQADSASPRRAELAVFGGVSKGARLDATASPRTFGGTGYDLGIAYDRPFGDRMTLSIASAFGAGTFASGDAGLRATQQHMSGDVGVAVLRRLGNAQARSSFALGVAMPAEFGYTRHHYANPGARVADFLMGTWTAGPVARWDAALGGGAVRAEIMSPLMGLAYRPYSDTRSGDPLTAVQLVGADKLRMLNGSLRYTPIVRRKFGLIYTYQFRFVDFVDVQPARAVTHSFSLGIVRR